MNELDKTTYFRPEIDSDFNGAKITIFDGVSEPIQFDLGCLGKNVITFGRDASNDIFLHSHYVSRKHGQFRLVNGQCIIEDLGSKNGLLFNGVSIRNRILEDNDAIRIDDGIETTMGGVLIVFSKNNESEQWKNVSLIGKQSVTIGRAEDCDIHLNHIGVSKTHAGIVCQNDKHYIVDNGSTNGVWLNGKKVDGKCLLHEKDIILITNSKLIFSANKISYCTFNHGIRVDAAHIFKKVDKGRKIICNNVSLNIEPCELVAIIGGSGAGKSTIMNCISGYSKPTSGEVKVNGIDLYHNFESMKDIIGYVPQQDIVFENLTVFDMLSYTAKLRLPKDISRKERNDIILKVIDTVELSAHKDTIIKRLSGGQRKRASIAVELISDPNLFFLDEPASGLDPGTERNLMRTLKGMTVKGKTVIFVTHSTLNLHMCDKIVFMGSGGKLCFCGSYDAALRFFGVNDLVDVYNLITENSDYWQKKYAESINSAPPTSIGVAKQQKKVHKHGWLHQMNVLAKRHLHILLNDKVRLMMILLQAPLLAVLISFVADGEQFKQYEMTKSLLFALSCSAFWIGILNSIQEICKERVILKREYMTGLRLGAYIVSKLFVMGLVCAVQAVLLTGVFSLMIGMPDEGVITHPFVELLLITFLTALSASAMGIFVSSLFKNADRAMTVAPILLMPQLLFSGLIFKLEGASEIISWIATCRFSMEGYGTTANLNSLEMRLQQQGIQIEHEVEDFFEFTAAHFGFAIVMLLVFVVVFSVLAGMVLKNIKKDRG